MEKVSGLQRGLLKNKPYLVTMENPYGVMFKVLDWSLKVSEFQFGTNTLGERYAIPYLFITAVLL